MSTLEDRMLIDREIEQAREELREVLTGVAERVEQAEENLNPKRLLERHPIAAACSAGALGFFIGGGSDEESFLC